MAVRATSAIVFAINTELDQTIDITQHLIAANQIVNDNCLTSGYDEEKLTVIENWVATHIATINDPRLTFEGMGDIQGSYQHKEDLGFDTTHFGQMAKKLDPKGNLAKLDQKQNQKNSGSTPGIVYLGGKVNDAYNTGLN